MPKNIDKSMAQAFAKNLWSGVIKGYGKDLSDIDYTTPHFDMLASLQLNTWNFSAAKNYTQMRQLTQALIGDDGKLRTYSQFKKAAFEINDAHVNNWLKTEYETAIASSQMAAKWVDIEANKNRLGMLEFDAVMDGRTTDLCAGLNGVLKHIDDPFWNTFYPPNHYSCRSSVRQRSGGDSTPDTKIQYPEIPKMFQTNLAKEGLVFPKGSNYWIGIPDNIGTLSLIRHEIKEVVVNKYIDKFYPDNNGEAIKISKGGLKEIFNQNHDDKVKQMQLLNVIPQLIQNADFIKSAEDYKKKCKAFSYYKVRGVNNMYLVIRENFKGEKDLYSIVDKIK